MPQLDINTFGYQYTGILILLITMYVILSYVVLPSLLRVIFIRSKYSESVSNAKDLAVFISEVNFPSLALAERSAILLSRGLSAFALKISATLKNITSLLNVVAVISTGSNELSNRFNSNGYYFNVVPTSVFYLGVLLFLDPNSDAIYDSEENTVNNNGE
jgi:hypothetical protein